MLIHRSTSCTLGGIRWSRTGDTIAVYYPSAIGLHLGHVELIAGHVHWIDGEPSAGCWQPVTSTLEADLVEERCGRTPRYRMDVAGGEEIDAVIAAAGERRAA